MAHARRVAFFEVGLFEINCASDKSARHYHARSIPHSAISIQRSAISIQHSAISIQPFPLAMLNARILQ
jgi:hypothetical protein